MELENLDPVPGDTISSADLFSAARREFKNSNLYSGKWMKELENFFQEIAVTFYDTQFIWSEYNKGQWDKFVSGSNSFAGGCVFSMEKDGAYSEERHHTFQYLFVGGYNGLYPYAVESCQAGKSVAKHTHHTISSREN